MKSIFVSSTFRDMQSERDLLHTDVIPVLAEEARKNGESISFIDLRWGVNTNDLEDEDGSKKVLSVCLDEIDRSQPYMLIFLGERYGWMPDGRLLQAAAQAKSYTIDDLEKSVTALEIEYGALSANSSLDRCVVCIREPLDYDEMDEESKHDYCSESPIHKQKLDALKDRIKTLFGSKIIIYSGKWDPSSRKVVGLTDLGSELVNRFMVLFREEWDQKADLSWQEQELLGFELFTREKCRMFAGRETLLCGYQNDILDNSSRITIIKGTAGSGKSSIMSMLYTRLKTAGCNVFPFICGNSARSSSADDMLLLMVWYLETLLGKADHSSGNMMQKEVPEMKEKIPTPQLQKIFSDLAKEYAEKYDQTGVFLLDGLDQLNQSELLRTFGFLPQNIGQNLRFVISCLDNFTLPALPHIDANITYKTLPLLETGQVREVLENILNAQHKGLDNSVWKALLRKEGVQNPLYAGMLLQRLIMMDSDDLRSANNAAELNEQMLRIIGECPQSVDGMCAAVLKEAGERINLDLSGTVLSLLAASRHGLRTSDLEAIFIVEGKPWNNLDFSRLLRYLAPYFMLREDGRWDFTHKTIRQGFLSDMPEQNAQHDKMILKLIKMLPQNDSLRLNEGLYHTYRLNDYAFLDELLTYAWHHPGDVLEAAVCELKQLCLMDEGRFLYKAIENENYMLPESFALDFLRVRFVSTFGISDQEKQIKLSLLESLMTRSNHYLMAQNTTDNRRDAMMCAYELGTLYHEMSDEIKALAAYEQALKLLEEGIYDDHSSLDEALAYFMMGECFSNVGEHQKSLSAFLTALHCYEDIHLKQNTLKSMQVMAIACQQVAQALCEAGHLEQSFVYINRTYDYFKQLYAAVASPENLWQLIEILKLMGDTYRIAGQPESSLMAYKQLYDCCEDCHRMVNNPESLVTLANTCSRLGVIYTEMSNAEQGIDYHLKELSCREHLQKVVNSKESLTSLINCLFKIGSLYHNNAQPEEAMIYNERYCDAYKELHRRHSNVDILNDLMAVTSYLGSIYISADNPEKALAYYEYFRQYSDEAYVLQNSVETLKDAAMGCFYLGYLLYDMGCAWEALPHLETYLDYNEQLFDREINSENFRSIGVACEKLGDAYMAVGEPQKSVPYYERQIKYGEALGEAEMLRRGELRLHKALATE